MKFFPDRKVLAGGLSAVVVWAAALVLAHFGVALPPDVQTGLVTIVGFGFAYFVPPAEQDIVKRLNDRIVALGAADPAVPVNPTTRPQGPAKQ